MGVQFSLLLSVAITLHRAVLSYAGLTSQRPGSVHSDINSNSSFFGDGSVTSGMCCAWLCMWLIS